ncbi:MAG: succinate dehydrogenase cytochrome b subunit [Acidobacteria bacterium]|nr:succinate dehydrogenase cytochrome b subunit [Acidobacteriota bacterium]
METATVSRNGTPWVLAFYRSALGKKAVMAATGIMLFGFVFVHMVGNLKLYLGADAINHYGRFLREIGYPLLPHEGALWIARVVLLGAVALHITSAIQVWLMAKESRPEAYTRKDVAIATYASRTMRWGGLIVLAFILFHLADLTLGRTGNAFVEGDVYANVISSFSRPPVAIFYIIANLMLGLHLYHGLWSMFQSLGWNNPRFNSWRNEFAAAFAVVITIGNISFPISVMLGLVK